MKDTGALKEIFPSSRVKTDQADLMHWGTDWTRSFDIAPQEIVFPQCIDEIVALVKLARDRSLGLVPSGVVRGCRAVLSPPTTKSSFRSIE